MTDVPASGLASWRNRPIAQQPDWPDPGEVKAVAAELAAQPPLVFSGECDLLKQRLAAAALGEAFVLQGGDCAETFQDATAGAIAGKLKILLQMAAILTYAGSAPVVKIGRMAGQFAKPRSRPVEVRDGVALPSYRGDIVNGIGFTPHDRRPDPARMLRAYHCSAMTLNLARAFTTGGYADLRQIHAWNQDFVDHSLTGQRYERLAGEIDRALAFMKACGADPEEFHKVEFYSSHEALLLEYEQALTRLDPRTGLPYNVSAHLLWIGERTRALDGAHVEYLRQVRNPIGVKLGPTTTPDDALALMDLLNPEQEPGRLTFITRMGADNIREALPPLVEKVNQHGPVVWVCDPMHGNTFTTSDGYKSRDFDHILNEVFGFFQVHQDLGTHPGGIHLEFTGEEVTECVGGDDLTEDHLHQRYESACDPRLNRCQALDLAFLIAEMYDWAA